MPYSVENCSEVLHCICVSLKYNALAIKFHSSGDECLNVRFLNSNSNIHFNVNSSEPCIDLSH